MTLLPKDDTSFEDFLNSDKVIAVVNLLTKFKIKLWELKNLSLPESQPEVEELLMKLSDESGLVERELKSILVILQQHSVSKLNDNKRFKEDGIAVFKVKIVGSNKTQEKVTTNKLEASINLTGLELKSYIHSFFDLNCENLKIICNGKLIKEDSLLVSQDIKNHSTLMVMCVYEKASSGMASSKDTENSKLAEDIKDAVNLLTNLKSKGYDIDFNLQDQNGNAIEISPENSSSLTSAMILHEQAKNLMKSKEYLKALILLAEADNEFKNCSDKGLLEKTDNYGLLNLDIIWCHLCLENLNELKNAEERLETCERCFKKCYGSDLERLSKIKSDTVNKHTPIFVRLNLLNAILNYHKGKKRECKVYLDIASRELKKITIDEDKLLQVMSMGFSSTESRLALRASFNNVDEAIEQIIKKNKQKKEMRELEKQKERAQSLEKKYGRTVTDNKPIDIKLLDDLMQLGYTEKQAARGLIKANNNFQLSLDLINLDQNDEPISSLNTIEDDSLSQLAALGFDTDMCRKALEAFGSNLEKATNFLLENGGGSQMENLMEKVEALLANLPSSARKSPSASTSSMDIEKTLQAQRFLKKISKEMPKDDEEYLDFNIDEDSFYINKYYSLME